MKVIDLFAGCGGLSLGFEMAGFNIPIAIEKDEWASETYKKNHPSTKVLTGDITQIIDLENIISKKDLPIDGIIGGPPCQGFSYAGWRDPNDKRNQLFRDFVELVKRIKPKFFVMENVLGILTMRKGEAIKEIIEAFEEIGYHVNKPLNVNESLL